MLEDLLSKVVCRADTWESGQEAGRQDAGCVMFVAPYRNDCRDFRKSSNILEEHPKGVYPTSCLEGFPRERGGTWRVGGT